MSASIWKPGSGGTSVSTNNTLVTENFTVSVLPTTVFTLTTFTYVVNTGSLRIYINGVRQIPGTDFTETSSNSFTLAESPQLGDVVSVDGFTAITADLLNTSPLAANLAAPTGASLIGYGIQTLKNFLDAAFLNLTGLLSINGGPIGSIKDAVVNGPFRIDQRNEGAVQTFTAGAALAYCVDRFYGYCTGANITGQQITVSGENRYRFTGAASNTGLGFGHRIKARNLTKFAGRTVTLGVKLSSSSITTVSWAAYYANSTNTFGSLAAPTKTLISSGAFTINSVDTDYGIQIAVPSAATTGVEVILTCGALLAGQTLTIGDFRFANTATLETYYLPKPYDLDLVQCLAHYEKSFLPGTVPASAVGTATGEKVWRTIVAAASAAAGSGTIPLFPKFALPTITLFNPDATGAQVRDETNSLNCSSTSASAISQNGFTVLTTGNASTTVASRLGIHFTAEAEL